MADKPEGNPPSGTQNETSSTQMQDTVLIRMLTILQNIEQNQQKDRTDRGEQENKVLGQILATQNKMLEIIMASHKTEKTGERWREGTSETVTEEETNLIPPVVQDSTVSTTGHTLSGNTVMVGRNNTNIVNNSVRCNMIVYVLNNSDQSGSNEQSNSVETQLRNAICDRNNPLVQEMEKMLEATLDDVRTGSIILVFLTANRNHFRNLFDQHELKIKCLMENYIKKLSRGTKASYRIDIKIEDDNQDTGKDKSSKGISFTKKDNLHNEGKQSGSEDDDDDDDDDDDNNGAASANPYTSGSLDEKRHEVMGKSMFSSNGWNRPVGGSLRRNDIDRVDEGSSSDNLTFDNNLIIIKKKGVLKNKNRLPLKMGSKAQPHRMTRLQSHGEKSKSQEKFRDDDNSDDDKQDNLDVEQRRMVSRFPDVSHKHRMHDSNDDLQNYDNNVDDKNSKDGKDYREMSIGRQFSPDETELDIIHRRDKVMSEEDILHSDRNHQRRKASKGNRSDDNTNNSGMCAKGKDSRGVQRGECKGCNECPEFKGDARCDYCNCAATQHTNLIHGSSNLDTTASASKMGNVQDPKGKDGRGIKRGKCTGCTECSEFRGDVRCDYCNCTATQHVNLTNLPIEKTSPSTFSREASENARGNDRQGIWRGNCNGCTECLGFTGDARCDYCNCAATQHLNLTQLPSKKDNPSTLSKGALNNAKGKDGRGIKRGKCTGCTECSEFRGDVRCDYCNCTATQHVNLTNLPIEKTSPSTFSREASENARGNDRQGIWRGNCNGCTECLGFTGDARCDYCNCAATQHLNLTQLPSKKDNPSTLSKGALNNAKGIDGRGIKRGKCSGCTECSEFSGDVRCDYCNCAATQHFNCTHPSSSIDTSGYLPRTSQPGIDSRGVRREKCTSCKECSFFIGADRCDYCNCTAAEHIRHADHLNFTDPTSNTGITIDWSNYELIQKVLASKKSYINSWTQDYTLRIRVRPHSQQPNGVSLTELQQQFNNSIQNNKMQIRRDVQDVFGAVFDDIRFENGCIIINMSINQLERDAEIMLTERREKIENYAKSLVKDIFPVQFMNLNWHRNHTLEIDMVGIFRSLLTDSWQQSSNH